MRPQIGIINYVINMYIYTIILIKYIKIIIFDLFFFFRLSLRSWHDAGSNDNQREALDDRYALTFSE